MEKRVVVFLILALAIIIGYDYLMKELGYIQPPDQTDQPSATAPYAPPDEFSAAAPTDTEARDAALTGVPGLSALSSPSAVSPAELTSVEEFQEVETELYRAVFTTRGAVVKSWELKRYTNPADEGPLPVQLIYREGNFRRPLLIQTQDPNVSRALSEGLYHVERDFFRLDDRHPTGHMTFTHRIPDTDIEVEKRLTFHHDSYLVDIDVKTQGLTNGFDIGLGTNFGIVEWGEGFIGLFGPAFRVDDTLEKKTPDTELVRTGPVRWVALQDKYFMSVLIPAEADALVVKNEGEKLASAGVRFAPPTASRTASMRLYAGPKEFETLKSLNVGLEDTIDFGWFIYGSWAIVKAIAKPLFYVLRYFHDFTHNYGLSIILLTVCVKLFFVPLQYKSYKSMKDMQTLQPKVAALQSKYKDDRERLNKELISLYRDHKVNPVGGCLPMLLQMPVFIALFNILYMTIDLRQAPFFLWITDLSVQDPYFVLPVIMGLSMMLQQKIMPTTMDPTQAKMMMLLPAFLTILFLTFPAGLVLYWLTNNVLTIAQQFITDRYIFKRPTFAAPPVPAPATDSGSNEKPNDKPKPAGKKAKHKAGRKSEADSEVKAEQPTP